MKFSQAPQKSNQVWGPGNTMTEKSIILRSNPDPLETEWIFKGLKLPRPVTRQNGEYRGLHITFTPDKITLGLETFPSNRVLQTDNKDLFALASFSALRFEDVSPSVNIDYIKRFLKTGLNLNGQQYWFYGHSNSQLRSRSCFLRKGQNEAELHTRIMGLGDFGSIKSAAKLSKRIGLLFSSATLDWILEPEHIKEYAHLVTAYGGGPTHLCSISDIEQDDVLFSDGCGLISHQFSRHLAFRKRIIFRQRRYVPSVFQIRYRGYKGVLMMHPELDKSQEGHVHFRKSMKKFKVVNNNTFSIVEHSVPYVYARLNNDIVTLLSALGVSDEVLLQKLQSYLAWLSTVKSNLSAAVDFLSSINQHVDVERVLLEGLDSPSIQSRLSGSLKKEIAAFKKGDTDKDKLRLLVHDSRYVFGVCDPFQLLEEGEVFIRVTMPRTGPTTIHSCPVLVVRNPCLHPGDCLKLRAVDNPKLRHLVDCVVFASKGKHAAPSLSSGGDLDGDQYTVIWDKQLVPPKIAEHFLYPAVKERKKENITRQDLAAHFAGYNSISMGRAATLHWKWVRCTEGAMSKECQELNALYSQCVDGAMIKIPDRLRFPPEPSKPFIVDIMLGVAKEFAKQWLSGEDSIKTKGDKFSEEQTIAVLLSSQRISMSEFQTLQLAFEISRRSSINLRPYYGLMHFNALNSNEKHEICALFNLAVEDQGMVWNSLMRSDILSPSTFKRNLSEPTLQLQRLYTTATQGLSGFFEYLQRSMELFNRRLILLRTDDRFSIGIFIRGQVPWNEEVQINENVAVVALTPTAQQSMSLYRHTVHGYRLHCSDGLFQLYNKGIQDTWIFINRPPYESFNELQTSIALQKISSITQKHVGRINKTPIVAVEIHVVSNQDRVAQQIFDLRLDRVPTEEKLRSISQAEPYSMNALEFVDWTKEKDGYHTIFTESQTKVQLILRATEFSQLNDLMDFALHYHEEARAFWIFDAMLLSSEVDVLAIAGWILRYPHLVFSLLRSRLDVNHPRLTEPFDTIRQPLIEAVVLSTNDTPIAALVALEKLGFDIAELSFAQYSSVLWNASMVVRGHQTVQEILLVLHEQRKRVESSADAEYAHRQALQVAFERAEEAFESCPCDEQGRPTRQRTAPIRVRIHPKLSKKKAPATDAPLPDPVPVDDALLDPATTAPSLKLPIVVADIRVDKPSTTRLHSHVRLAAASKPGKQTLSWRREILDGVVKVSFRGEMEIELFHHPPPEYSDMEWSMYDCGSTATTRAMMDAVKRIYAEKFEACEFSNLLTGSTASENVFGDDLKESDGILVDEPGWEGFNASQKEAIQRSFKSNLSLIWGPPGTGKTTVIVKILELLLPSLEEDSQILMTASTHNAVDNVLERFAQKNAVGRWLPDDAMVRAATDHSKVGDSVKRYTVDALIGGSPTDDPKLIKKAEKRMKEAKIVFTTCAGAGLGVLRKLNFTVVLIDEASQVTEGVALIPLVKGCRKAIMVGDHVQLRPTVKRMSVVLQSDVSLFERLYTSSDAIGISKAMLNVQYRFAEELARFPSERFYGGKLGTGTNTSNLQKKLLSTHFPWPKEVSSGKLISNVFVPCFAPEDLGQRSKQNEGQAKLVAHIVELLRPSDVTKVTETPLTIAVLTPYTKQVKCLKNYISDQASISTIDGIQGREADFIVYSSVRSNASNDIGFLVDERRLNVAWTRARVARIVVGDPNTLKFGKAWRDEDNGDAPPEENDLWKQAIEDCHLVTLSLPEERS